MDRGSRDGPFSYTEIRRIANLNGSAKIRLCALINGNTVFVYFVLANRILFLL